MSEEMDKLHAESDAVFEAFTNAIKNRSIAAILNATMSVLAGVLAEMSEGNLNKLDSMINDIGPSLKESSRRTLQSWATGEESDPIIGTEEKHLPKVVTVSAEDLSPQADLHRAVQDAVLGHPIDMVLNSSATVLTGCLAQLAVHSSLDIDVEIDNLALQLKAGVRHALTQTKGARQ